MDQVLTVASDVTTLLLPLVLVLLLGITFYAIKLLITINKTADSVKETTFLVNNVLNSSLFTVTSFISGLFENNNKKERKK